MIIRSLSIPDVLVVEPDVHRDERGWFLETWNSQRYRAAGLPSFTAQDNLSFSVRGVLRGLHFQRGRPQGKLVYVIEGAIFDVAVDLRPESATFGQWVSLLLSSDEPKQLFVPEGFAHGFCVVSDRALVAYKCTSSYDPKLQAGVRWDDPHLAIPWPLRTPVVSEQDSRWPAWASVADSPP